MPRMSAAILFLLTLSHGQLWAGPQIDDTKFGFKLTLPDRFVPDPAKVGGDTIYAYTRPANGARPALWIMVERMRGVIGQEKLGPPPPGGPAVSISTEKWKTFDLQVMHTSASINGLEIVAITTQVPLAGEAIQLTLGGPATEEAELQTINRSLLASLDGRSNWMSGEDRWGKLYVGITTMVLVGGGIAAVIIFAMRQGRSRKKNRRTWDDDDYDRPRRPKHRQRDDDDDDRPRRPRRGDDDSDDDRPRR
jgi:hypothetical protein